MYTGGGYLPPRFTQPQEADVAEEVAVSSRIVEAEGSSLPNVLITNDDGINAPGLRALVAALIEDGSCHVFVCAPDSEKSSVSHSITPRAFLEVASVNIPGASAFETSGTPADCVSLAMTASIFPWTKPTLVVSGINKGSNCGYHIFYSGTVAGAREAYISGVPAISISLDWKRGKSSDDDFKSAAAVSLPLIKASLRDIQGGVYPKGFFLNVDLPASPSEHKGYKVTRQGTSRLSLKWKKVTQEKRMQMLKDTGIGLQMSQLGLAASAAGAARRANFKKQNPDIESVGANEESDKEPSPRMRFRLEGAEQELGAIEPDHDFGALQQGYVSITALGLDTHVEATTCAQVEEWVAGVAPSAL
jgi:5'-nucleotidase